MQADLHVHTVASDGTATLAERIEQARERGIDAVAVTDHDTLDGTPDGRAVVHDGLEVIAGVEVRADVDGTKVELLGYFLDPDDGTLQSLLDRGRKFRAERNRQLVENLRTETEFDRSYDALRDEVGGLVGRPHLAAQLVYIGVVPDVGTAFERYLGSDGDCFVPMRRLPASEVIETVRTAGGVTSLAHPGRIRADAETVVDHVAHLAAAGLDAVEVAYPYETERSPAYAGIGVAEAAELAVTEGLRVTGGSDCHGPGSGKFRLGETGVGAAELAALRALARRRGSRPIAPRS